MKFPILRSIIAVISLSFCQSASAENPSIVGKFDGIIWSNYEQPGVTEFYLTTDQNIEARYIFTHGEVDSEGLLRDCSLTEFVLRCIWNDDYGEGDFVAEFNSDLSSFSGKWFDETSSDKRIISDPSGHLWTGKKQK